MWIFLLFLLALAVSFPGAALTVLLVAAGCALFMFLFTVFVQVLVSPAK